MEKIDLWHCSIGDQILYRREDQLLGDKVTVVDKATLPAGFTELQLIKLRTQSGEMIEVDCTEKSYTVTLLRRNGRPINVSLSYIVKAKPTESQVVHGIDISTPIGYIPEGGFFGKEIPEGWLLCDGEAIKIDEYPELFEVIGNHYSDTREIKHFTLTPFEKIKKLLGIKFTPRTYTVETRSCSENEFRVPDLTGYFIR